jgi:hypothetical protein
MSTGTAIAVGVGIGLILSVAVVVLGPLASDVDLPPERLVARLRKTEKRARLLFVALALWFVAAIFTLDPPQIVIAGASTGLMGLGVLSLRRRIEDTGGN